MAMYNLDRLTDLILAEQPELSREEATRKAIELRRLLHRMDEQWRRSSARFHRHHDLFGFLGDWGEPA